MNIAKIIAKRNCGQVRLNYCTNYDYSLDELLTGFDLKANQAALTEINAKEAVDIITALLWKGLAYNSEIMPLAEAQGYANELVESFAQIGNRFFTNAEWQKYHEASAFSYHSFTDATIDGGIMVTNANSAMVFWVEDED